MRKKAVKKKKNIAVGFGQYVWDNRFVAFGLLGACGAVAYLIWMGFQSHKLDILGTPAFAYTLGGGGVGLLATLLGSLPALLMKKMPQRLEDGLLGVSGGMMLAACAFSLILPSLDAAKIHMATPVGGVGLVLGGMALGSLLMLGLEVFLPHEHTRTGAFGPKTQGWHRLWLFVVAIALHNLPEGMAIGASFAKANTAVGYPVTLAIAIQNMPEGLAVALALRRVGVQPWVAVLLSLATGLLEPLGGLVGLVLSSGSAVTYPVGLAVAAGAMLFVVSHEVIPETHRNGHQTAGTMGLMAGFGAMLLANALLEAMG